MAAKETVLVVFIHGFKGTDTTFGGFPDHLQHVLSETIENFVIECIVFPVYETKGDLAEAVDRFADWLTDLTVQRECSHGTGGGAASVRVVLCGHSMGGIIAADALLKFVHTRPDKQAPLWPKIVACIAFDTPYLGLHPVVFKNSATKAIEYASTAHTAAASLFASLSAYGAKKSTEPVPAEKRLTDSPSSKTSQKSSWGNWAPAAFAVGGALLAGAAGAAYYKREDLGTGYAWATDHMKYIGNLWDEEALRRRMEQLIDVEEQFGVTFRVFYTTIAAAPPAQSSSRTFIILPPKSSRSFSRFFRAWNGIASDEIQAHTGMFEARSNDGYYELSLQTARLVNDSVMPGNDHGDQMRVELPSPSK